MRPPPNLFNYATSELSQDAFLCWLIAYADEEYKENHPLMHRAGREFLKACGIENFQRFTIHRQYCRADVVIIFDKPEDGVAEQILVIENKLRVINVAQFESQIAAQLDRYVKDIKKKDNPKSIVGVFYILHEQAGIENELRGKLANYRVIQRAQMLEILSPSFGKGAHGILQNYYLYIKWISDHVKDFATVDPKDWGWYRWLGFYKELEKQLQAIEPESPWCYVPPPPGQFSRYSRGGHQTRIDGEDYLLYIESQTVDLLCVRITRKKGFKEVTSAVLKRCFAELEATPADEGWDWRKPTRFQPGKHGTFARVDGVISKYGIQDGKVNAKFFQDAQLFLDKVATRITDRLGGDDQDTNTG